MLLFGRIRPLGALPSRLVHCFQRGAPREWRTAARGSGAESGADSAASTTAPVSPALSLPAEEAREASRSDDSLVWF